MKGCIIVFTLVLIACGTKPAAPASDLSAIYTAAPPLPDTPAYYPDLSISMGRGSCLGSCPVYRLGIDAKGNVIYEGVDWVAITGKRSARITPQQIDELVAAIKRANIWTLKDAYFAATDLPSIGLSIRLNGQSKRIWHAGKLDCGKYDGGAPMALCELEREIEATVNSNRWVKPMSMSASGFRGRPPASFRPSRAASDFGIVSQEPCGPPCFQGIRPGITTFWDARLIVKNAGQQCRLGDTILGENRWLICRSGDTHIEMVASGTHTVDEMRLTVDRIHLQPPVKVTVGELIAQYGPPDSLVPSNNGDGQRLGMGLNYDRLQTRVILAMLPGIIYTVTPGTTIESVDYQTAANYQRDRSWEADNGFLQPWKGYGAY